VVIRRREVAGRVEKRNKEKSKGARKDQLPPPSRRRAEGPPAASSWTAFCATLEKEKPFKPWTARDGN